MYTLYDPGLRFAYGTMLTRPTGQLAYTRSPLYKKSPTLVYLLAPLLKKLKIKLNNQSDNSLIYEKG